MYKRDIYTVLENKKIAKDVFLMVLEGDTQYITAPGQFINILVEGFYLRRPISICDWDDKTITIIYKVVGKGTEAMAEMKAGKKLDIRTGLGNGFTAKEGSVRPLVIGGGVGAPPMYGVAKHLVAKGAMMGAGAGSKGKIFGGAQNIAAKNDAINKQKEDGLNFLDRAVIGMYNATGITPSGKKAEEQIKAAQDVQKANKELKDYAESEAEKKGQIFQGKRVRLDGNGNVVTVNGVVQYERETQLNLAAEKQFLDMKCCENCVGQYLMKLEKKGKNNND